MAKKEEKKDVLENPEVIAEKLEGVEHWIESNPKTIISVVGVIVLVVGGYFGFQYYQKNQNAQAQKEMFQAVRYFEADSLNLAMKGDGNNLGFEQIIDDYGMTDAGNLANFYAGVINLKQGKYSLAVFYLQDFKSNDILVQARAYSLLGDAYMEQKDFENAVKYYGKASDYKPNKFYTPSYLMKLALAYEKLNQTDKAIATYDRIINQYFESAEYQTARKYKASLEKNS
jgi:predicted negative regulator of RcsB-dependent stress response